MTLPLYHTRDLERATRALCARYSRVMIRNKSVLWSPIRLRRRLLADLNPKVVLTAPEFDHQLQQWNEEGGLLFYDRAFRRSEDVAAHHAQFIPECPMSIERLENFTQNTRELIVVYRPPNWNEHIRYVDDVVPTAERCANFHAFVRAQPSRDDVEVALGRIGFTVCSDATAAKALGLSTMQIAKARGAIYRRRSIAMVTQVVTRVEPVGDPVLQRIYYYIETHFPETPEGVRLIVNEALGNATRWWRMALRDMARQGAIDWRETLFCYTEDALPPAWHKIQAAHDRAKRELAAIVELIHATPDYFQSEGVAVESITRVG